MSSKEFGVHFDCHRLNVFLRVKRLKITDYVVQELMDEEFDKDILHEMLFPVNMRLFKTSEYFRQLIFEVLDYMDSVLSAKFDDYTQPRGMSGANLGIPWNIIGVRGEGKSQWFENRLYINPIITDRSEETETVMSNCGSIRLPEPIPVKRNVWIDLDWYDEEGEHHSGRFYKKDGGFTIQHEVEHNLGILITDRRAQV